MSGDIISLKVAASVGISKTDQNRRDSHRRYVAFQIAENAIPRNLFADILRRISELRL
jgi:hypothetical protein